jgi:hypothetical protein
MAVSGEAPDAPAPILPQVGREHQPQPGPHGEAPPAGGRAGGGGRDAGASPLDGATA